MIVLTRNVMKTHFLSWSPWFDPYWPGEIDFYEKWRFWPKTSWKLIFYPGQHGLTRIDPVKSVFLWKMMVLTRNVTKTHFLPWSTWFDPYWPDGLGFDKKWRFWLKITVLTRNVMKTHFLPWSTWFDPYWPGEISFYGKMRLTREKYILNFKLFS